MIMLLKLFFFIIYLHYLVAALPPCELTSPPLPSCVGVPAKGLIYHHQIDAECVRVGLFSPGEVSSLTSC